MEWRLRLYISTRQTDDCPLRTRLYSDPFDRIGMGALGLFYLAQENPTNSAVYVNLRELRSPALVTALLTTPKSRWAHPRTVSPRHDQDGRCR